MSACSTANEAILTSLTTDENAVDLTFALMTLQDTYDVDNFEHLKLGMLSALVAAVPTKVAP